MKINVIDVEATCWERPTNIPSEIIQIGISQLDTNRRDENGRRGYISPPFSVFVKPLSSFSLSPFCRELTGLTDEQVFGEGILFAEALALLDEKYELSKIPWASWGDYDRAMMVRMSERDMIRPPLSNQHLNAKTMFFLMTNRRCGAVTAVEDVLKMEWVGRNHDGGDDAYNTARILRELIPHTSQTKKLI